jgi:hypothetical protein
MLWPILLVWLLFSGVSLLGTPVPGVNEPHYVCKARSLIDPDWCERDFFLRSANVHWCFLFLTGWWSQWISFSGTVITGRLLSALVLSLGWRSLCGAVGLNGWRSLLAASIFAVVTQLGSFSGEWILGGYESKVPAWGLGWAALGYWIGGSTTGQLRRVMLAGLCCGLSVTLHPVVGGWFGVGVAGASVLRVFCGGRIRSEVISLGVFGAASIFAALPGLLPALRFLLSGQESTAVRDRAIFVQVYWRLRHHLDPTAITAEQWWFAGLLLSLVLLSGLWLQGGRRLGLLFGCGDRDKSLANLQRVLMVALALASAGILVGWHADPVEQMQGWQWRGNLLRFYPFRFFDGMLPTVTAIMVVLCGARLSESLQAVGLRALWPKWAMCLLVLFAGAWGLAMWKRPAAPAGYTRAGWRDWQAACVWLQTHTEKASLVLTPRESFAFKWLSERAEYVCYKDCPQDPAGIVKWDSRLWKVHAWSAESLQDGRYDAGDLERLRLQTGCDYILIRGQEPFESVPAWSGEYWKIYRVH